MTSEYRFKIDGSYTPATMPMERLAAYLSELARLLGEPSHVHFQDILTGSTVLRAAVDSPGQETVKVRLSSVREGTGPKDAMKAYRALDDMLRSDGATGDLQTSHGAVVLTFSGRDRPEPVVFGPFRQYGTLDGQVFRLGGKDETIHLQIRDGGRELVGLEADIHLAQQLRHYLLGPTLRLHGSGLWFRSADGVWELRTFKVESFEVLDDTPLEEVITRLRSVSGNDWSNSADPVAEILESRSEESTH